MSFFDSMNIVGSAMTAERFRMDVALQNIANANTTRTAEGGPYTRRNVLLTQKTSLNFGDVFNETLQGAGNGVKAVAITKDTETDYNLVYDPSHPDADENGYVKYPNVNIVNEMTDLIDATRSYEANATAFDASKSMASKGLELMN